MVDRWFHASLAWMNIDELHSILELSSRELNELLARLPGLDPVELVARLEALAMLDRRRAAFLDLARNDASTSRRRDLDQSLRKFVLAALSEIAVPQTAGFLEDYIYARERVLLKTRGFSALRRDENRAWRRQPEGRIAYIVPCLDPEGRALPRWMGRSDWPLMDRVAVPGAEELWESERFLTLLAAWREEPSDLADAVYLPLLEKYAASSHGDSDMASLKRDDHERLELGIEASLGVVREAIEERRRELAGAFERMSSEEQLWGRGDGAGRRNAAITGSEIRADLG
jgi:hypothetical protein